MKSTTRLALQQLEDRTVPAIWGNAWPDPLHLTLSFAPDKTPIDNGKSSLFALMGPNTAAWETTILRAYQTWAVNANINIGLVSDSGDSFTAGGAIQGDPRFGDIRIGAAPLTTTVLANTSPFDEFSAGSRFVFNPNYCFNLGGTNGAYDLFTVALHEAGHSFGFADNSDPTSALYNTYSGLPSVLSANDIAALQNLYGPRQLDQYAGAATPNNSMATAANLPLNGTIAGDISSNGQNEWFKFSTPLLSITPTTLEFRTSGVSLLTADVTVYNGAGHVVAAGQSTDPLNGNLQLTLPGLLLPTTYYIQVKSARSDVFGIGSYQMRVANDSLLDISNFFAGLVNSYEPPNTDALNLNGSQSTAAPLYSSRPTADRQLDVLQAGQMENSSDVDWYSIAALPYAAGTNSETMLVSMWGINHATLAPAVNVYNSAGQQIEVNVLTKDDYSCVLQLVNAVPGTKYYMRVSSDQGKTGDYRLAVNFQTTSVTVPVGPKGTLDSTTATAAYAWTLSNGGYMHFALSSYGSTSSSDGVSMTIYDSNGNIVTTLSAASGNNRSTDLYLAAGNYKIVFRRTGAGTSPLNFELDIFRTSDPVGITSTSASSPDSQDQTWSPDSGSYSASSSSSSQPTYY